MANQKDNSTAGHELTATQATAKFSGKVFQLKRIGKKVKDFIVDNRYMVTCEILGEDGWDQCGMTFKSFLRDKPELVTA